MTSGSRPRASVNGFGEFPGWVQPAISEEAHHGGVQRTARFGPSGLDADSAPRVVIKQDSGGQASPRVVDTQEQDHRGVSHGPQRVKGMRHRLAAPRKSCPGRGAAP